MKTYCLCVLFTIMKSLFSLIIFLPKVIHSANILFLITIYSPSHHLWHEHLQLELVNSGHNVTVLCIHPPKLKETTNFTALIMDEARSVLSEKTKLIKFDVAARPTLTGLYYKFKVNEMWQLLCEKQMQSEALHKLLTYPRDAFDLVFVDLIGTTCTLGIIEYFGNPPTIGTAVGGLCELVNDILNQPNPSYLPFEGFDVSPHEMTVMDRIFNKFAIVFYRLLRKYFTVPRQEEMAKKYLNISLDAGKVIQNLSLVFASHNPLFYWPIPHGPKVIPVGGMHIKPSKPLSADVQSIIDKSDKIIYFSLGTVIATINQEPSIIQNMLKCFESLKDYTILWKADEIHGVDSIPENVFVREWFSQNDILANSKVKLFITHGGLSSVQETIAHGVPMVGIPIIFDQFNNMRHIEYRKLGKTVHYADLISDDAFCLKVNEVLQDEKYTRLAQKYSQMFNDISPKPIETAKFWVEYLLKHKKLEHYDFVDTGFANDIGVLFVTLFCIFILHKAYKKLYSKGNQNINKKKIK